MSSRAELPMVIHRADNLDLELSSVDEMREAMGIFGDSAYSDVEVTRRVSAATKYISGRMEYPLTRQHYRLSFRRLAARFELVPAGIPQPFRRADSGAFSNVTLTSLDATETLQTASESDLWVDVSGFGPALTYAGETDAPLSERAVNPVAVEYDFSPMPPAGGGDHTVTGLDTIRQAMRLAGKAMFDAETMGFDGQSLPARTRMEIDAILAADGLLAPTLTRSARVIAQGGHDG